MSEIMEIISSDCHSRCLLRNIDLSRMMTLSPNSSSYWRLLIISEIINVGVNGDSSQNLSYDKLETTN